MSIIFDHFNFDTLFTISINIIALNDNSFNKVREVKFLVSLKLKSKKLVNIFNVVIERTSHERTRNFNQRLEMISTKFTSSTSKR